MTTAPAHYYRHMHEHAIVLGNGPSRKALDLDLVVGDCVVIGCNALSRDFPETDYLCAVDRRILQEWCETGPWHGVECYTSHGKVICPWVIQWIPFGVTGKLTGVYAILLAVSMGCSVIYVAGFDKSTENVYKGSRNYPNTPPRKALDDNYKRLPGMIDTLCDKLRLERPRVVQLGDHWIEWMEPMEVPRQWITTT